MMMIHGGEKFLILIMVVIAQLKIIDPAIRRASSGPQKTVTVSSQDFAQYGRTIKKIELIQYVERTDEKLGPYSLITSRVETDAGTVEMVYDRGFRGPDALDSASRFLCGSLGISGLVLRSIIALDAGKNDS